MKISTRRLLKISAVLMLLTALVHTAGNLASGSDAAQDKLEAAMRAFHEPLGFGMNPSMHDIYWELVFTMSLSFAALGALNLALARAPELSARLLRRVVWINVVWVAAFIALSLFHRIPPPLISGILIELPLIAALFVRDALVSGESA